MRQYTVQVSTNPFVSNMTSALTPTTPTTPETPGSLGISLASAADLAWAAGFTDGEGCIHLARQRYKNSNRSDCYRLNVHITQNDLGLLQHFRDVVGVDGRIYPVKLAANHNKQCYTLNFVGNKAVALLQVLRPYLRRKLAEANAALAYWSGCRPPHQPGQRNSAELMARREHFFLLLKELK